MQTIRRTIIWRAFDSILRGKVLNHKHLCPSAFPAHAPQLAT
jgi:hypothetical protein